MAFCANAQITAFDKGFDAFQRAKFDNAVHFYTIYIEDNKSPNAFFNRGLSYYKLGDFENAIADYSKVLEIELDDHEALYNRGLAYFEIGDFENAIADYEAVLDYPLRAPIGYVLDAA